MLRSSFCFAPHQAADGNCRSSRRSQPPDIGVHAVRDHRSLSGLVALASADWRSAALRGGKLFRMDESSRTNLRGTRPLPPRVNLSQIARAARRAYNGRNVGIQPGCQLLFRIPANG